MYYGSPDQGFIERTTFDGSNESGFITAQDTPTVMRVNGTLLYWVNSGTATIKSGAVPSATVAKQVASTTNAADGIAADGVNVYWVDSTVGSLNYAPISGAGPNTPYVTMTAGAATSPMRLVRDKGFLYFSYNGAIYRVALP